MSGIVSKWVVLAEHAVGADDVDANGNVRDEVVARVNRLQIPSYTGFVMPKLEAVVDGTGAVTDVTISYPMDLTKQMLENSAERRARVTDPHRTQQAQK